MSYRILVIDDSPLARGTARDILTAADYDVVEAVDGQDGLDKARQYQPHLILLDMILPKLDGQQVFQALQASRTTKSTPVIFLAAGSEARLQSLAAKAGAFAGVAKPVEPKVLLDIVAAALDQRRTAGRE